MTEHPIQGLMRTAMENLKAMVDVNTIVGDPVTTPDGTVILPISKVGFGFAAGGSEYTAEVKEGHADGREHERQRAAGTAIAPFESRHGAAVALPFGGGSGGGVSITPIAFLVVGTHGVKVVPLDNSTRMFERLIEQAPQMIDKLQSMISGAGGKTKSAEEQELNDVTFAVPMEPIPSSAINAQHTTL